VAQEGKNAKGRLFAILLRMVGKRAMGKELRQTVEAVEARYGAAC
jgi:hypothetical protein